MQGDTPDPSTLPPPSSPTVTSPFRHPQPTPTVDDAGPLSSLRRRGVSPTDSNNANGNAGASVNVHSDTVLIHIQTPFSDLGAVREHGMVAPSSWKDGWAVDRAKTVGELKDDIASGRAEVYGQWVREGMRLVWHGRIVDDQEAIGSIVGTIGNSVNVHSLHLVARPVTAPLNLPSRRHSPIRVPANTALPSRLSSEFPSSNRSQQPVMIALADTSHYLLFAARDHLCALIGAPSIMWDNTVPPPIVPRSQARVAVMSLVRTYATQLANVEEGWEGWEGAFDGDDSETLEALWNRLGKEAVENEVKSLWSSATGKPLGTKGEIVPVEVDHTTFNLHLPPLKAMTPAQLTHLLVYLRITALVPLIANILEIQSRAIPNQDPSPLTRTLPPAAFVRQARPLPLVRQGFDTWTSVMFNLPSLSLLTFILFSAVRVLAVLWMITRDMPWNDFRLWVLAGGGVGWWVAEVYNRWDGERVVRLARRREWEMAQGEPHAQANAQATRTAPSFNQNGNNQDANDVLDAAAAAARQNAANAPVPVPRARRGRARQRHPLTYLIPLFHLDNDNRQLRLPSTTTDAPIESVGQVPPLNGNSRQSHLPLRRHPSSQPAWFMTQLILPVYLWFVTLIPVFESNRARAIRRRERVMRAIIEEISGLSSAAEGATQASAATGDVDDVHDGARPREDSEETANPPSAAAITLPDDLFPAAIRYYRRIYERGEGIDWEEERDAQRAMGIPDDDARPEDAQQGALRLM